MTIHKGIKRVGSRWKANSQVNGIRRSKVFDNLRDAQYWRNNWHPLLNPDPKRSNPLQKKTGKSENGKDKEITVREVMDKYIALKLPTVSEASRYKKLNTLNKFLGELFSYRLSEVTPELLGHYVLRKKEVALKTDPQRISFDRDLKELSAVFNWYSDIIDFSFRNPVKRFHKELGKMREPKKVNKKIPAEDFVKFMKAFTEKQSLYRDMALLQFYSACRIHEVAGIHISNINLGERTLLIRETVNWTKRSEPKIKETTKTGEEKLVHVNDSMLEIIQRRLELRQPGCKLLFHRNGEILRYNAIQRNYNAALERAGLPYTGTHILRHSMATTTRKLLSLEHSQSVTGHKSRRMLEHYAELDTINLNKESVTSVERFIKELTDPSQNAKT